MSKDLKDLLHETADLDFATPDVRAITRAGDRTVRRRRVLFGVAGVAATAVVAAGTVALNDGDDGHDAPVAVDAAVDVGSITWVRGSELHSPDGTVDLGFEVQSYVRTAAGFVLADGNGVVHALRGGETERIGRTLPDDPQLRTDEEGSWVGWVSDGTSEVVVRDVAGGTEHRFATREGRVAIDAIDGNTAYWREGGQRVRADLTSGGAADEERAGDARVVGAEDGLVALGSDAGGVVIERPDGTRITELEAHGAAASFSPDARWVSLDGDEPAVYDVATGERVAVDTDGRWFGVGHEWLDDDTLVVFSGRSADASTELLTCEVPAGTCSVAIDELGTFEQLEGDFLLPVGEPMG